MKYISGKRRRAIEYEKDLIQYWKDNQIFEKSVSQRPTNNAYVFYDGPPFITGVPHHGTLLSSIVKDAVPRYQTMKGKRVERVWGWDCHGLPAENFVEKQLNIVDRRQIVTDDSASVPRDRDGNELPTITLEKYINTARESMTENSESWEPVVDRIGRWVDFRGAYRTMDKDFMESVWWAFSKLYDAGKIYEGEKVLMYDTKFATPVSKNEVTMDNDAYQTVTDPSVYVKFQLTEESVKRLFGERDFAGDPIYALAWTTTPWTLPGNTAIAVNTEMTYSLVRVGDEQLIIAQDCLDRTLRDDKNQPIAEYGILDKMSGEKLVGLEYKPLLRYDSPELSVQSENIYKIWPADYVSSESGTGIVHLAPIYGEEDFELAIKNDIPRLHILDDNGYYFPDVARNLYKMMSWRNPDDPLEVWDSNKDIAKGLKQAGEVWKIEYIRHEYPFNPRSKQRIMYRAIPSWFFDVQDSKPLLISQNENINWFPAHLKHGRFAKNIEQAPDWNLSRDRFWATAMPVWKSASGKIRVVGSYAELKELSGKELDDYHRPWVDDITFTIDGEEYQRIDKVLDCWFESGSMPFAQLHYPFENRDKFERNYPADFIVEYIGQVRAWFYYVHVVNTALAECGAFGELPSGHLNAYKNVISTGVVAGNDGRKMSKSLGNFTDPTELMDEFSADSLRFLLLSSPLLNGEDFSLLDKDVADTARKLTMIWNMYDFFTMYASVDGWEFDGDLTDPYGKLDNPLDQWIVSRIHQLVGEVETAMDIYDIPSALKPILPFIDDASNWYVRRSRRRFWKSEDDTDKNNAYTTLHYVLVMLAKTLAPFTPFLSEELYRNLTGGESVHLLDWPGLGHVNEPLVEEMARTRKIIETGLMLRMRKNDSTGEVPRKIRQPLARLAYGGEKLDVAFEQIIAEEVNVKQVEHIKDVAKRLEEYDTIEGDVKAEHWVEIEKKLTPELVREGQMREVVRFVQAARKKAGLNVDDRIRLALATEDETLIKAIDEWRDTIATETLATEISKSLATSDYETTAKVDSAELKISLARKTSGAQSKTL